MASDDVVDCVQGVEETFPPQRLVRSGSMQISCEVHDADAGVETVLWIGRWTLDSI